MAALVSVSADLSHSYPHSATHHSGLPTRQFHNTVLCSGERKKPWSWEYDKDRPIFSYDRYHRLKREENEKEENLRETRIGFDECFDVFREYCLGEDKIVAAHVQVPKPEAGSRPIRGDIKLPKPMSADDQSVVLVFAKGAQAEEAKRLGAHIVGGDELIQEIVAGNVTFDKALSTKEMFPQVVKIARILGPKGLMPSPAKGTVSDDLPTMMNSLSATSKFEADENGYIHLEIARTGWTNDQVFQNLKAFVTAVQGTRSSKADEEPDAFIESINISSEYVPGLRLPKQQFRAEKKKKTILDL
ncbi:hypothetical protein HDV00_005874 [Rhizophlyctis rosea]|nr:hypothetical protein HDV00_005874 [Rhizophlyctis rosea]